MPLFESEKVYLIGNKVHNSSFDHDFMHNA